MSSPIPYLGSKISLISKSEIRYEGILYTIDAQDSIIALAKVRSFGTEERPTEMPVPARDEVYEYIIFRGTDIKKIEVCEAPKQAMAIHNDPAIVQASQFGPAAVRHPLGPIGGGAPAYGYGQSMSQQGLPGAGFSGVTPVGAPSAGSVTSTTQASELMPGGGGAAAVAATSANSLAIGDASVASTATAAPHLSASGVVPVPIGPPSLQSRQSITNNAGGTDQKTAAASATPRLLMQQLLKEPPPFIRHHEPPADVLTGSRSPTPTQLPARKSPVSDAGVQVSPPPPSNDPPGRRKPPPPQQQRPNNQDRDGDGEQSFSRNNRQYNNDDRYGRNMRDGPGQMRDGRRNNQNSAPPNQNQNQGYNQGYSFGYNQGYNQGQGQYRNQYQQNQFYGGGYQGRGGNNPGMGRGNNPGMGMGMGMGRGGGGGGMGPRGGGGPGRRPRGGLINRGGPGGAGLLYVSSSRQREDKRLFEKDYDFEQANTQFEELRVQLASTKISSPGGSSTSNTGATEQGQENREANGEKEKKEDSGTETGPGEENGTDEAFYDKAKSFFDNISCEAVERSQGRSQRPDWRLERKINQETFGVATSRRGNYYNRGRGGYYNRGGYYRGGYNQGFYRGSGMGGGNYRGGRGGVGRGGNNTSNNSNGPATRNQDNDAGPAAAPPASESAANSHSQAVDAQ